MTTAIEERPIETSAAPSSAPNAGSIDAGITLDREHAESILHALLIGLDSYGEIERIGDAYRLFESLNRDLPDQLKPIHPTGAADTIGQFTDALRLLTAALRTS